MNRFKIKKGKEKDFENIWASRDSHLDGVDGFIEFNLIKGNSEDSFSLYASHSKWKSRDSFKNWTQSESFKLAHKNAGKHRDIYIEPPHFEGFEVVL